MVRGVLCGVVGAALVAVPAFSSETITYTYDALGRLTAAVSSGAVNNGLSTGIAYDPAGNRTSYAVTGASGGGSPPPPPPPNNPPVANSDSLMVAEWQPGTVNVVANDTDPDGDYPLTLLSVSEPGGRATVASSTTVGWNASPAGNYVVTYTVRDSRGATAHGVVNVQVMPMMCGEVFC